MVSRKILILTQHFHPENFRINDVALYLKDQGHKVTVLTCSPDYPSPDHYKHYTKKELSQWNGIRIQRVPIISRKDGSFFRLALNYISFVFSATVLGFPLGRKYDLCFVWASSPITVCLPAMFFKWTLGLPYVVWVQDLWPETLEAVGVTKSPFVLKQVGRLVRVIYKNAQKLLIQSEGFRKNIEQWGEQKTEAHYVPNWADTISSSEKNTLNLPSSFSNSHFKILYAGNLGKAQNLLTLIDAAERLKDQPISWYLMGDGSAKSELLEEIKNRGLSDTIYHIPQQPSSHLEAYFKHVDALCVTLSKSSAFALTVPSKVQTYMSAQKPLLAAIDGVTQDLIRDSDCGFAGPAEDPQSLALNVKKLQNLSEKERSALGKNAFEYYSTHFEKGEVLKKINKLLKDAQLKSVY